MAKYTRCDCQDYKENMPKVDAPILLADLHGMKYDGKYFVFCPWCGKKMREPKVDAE